MCRCIVALTMWTVIVVCVTYANNNNLINILPAVSDPSPPTSARARESRPGADFQQQF